MAEKDMRALAISASTMPRVTWSTEDRSGLLNAVASDLSAQGLQHRQSYGGAGPRHWLHTGMTTQPRDGVFSLLDEVDARKLIMCRDPGTDLRAVIAIHSTVDGCAGGGIRMKPYASDLDACRDALRLASAMASKYAAAGMAVGGAKAVIIGDPATDKTPELLRSFGRFVEQQGGEYFAGEDVGTDGDDMIAMSATTDKLLSLPERAGGPGDVSVTTAAGVRHAIRACCQRVWGVPDVAGRSIGIQGLGQVGMKLARMLATDGAQLVVADVDAARAAAAAEEFRARVVGPEEICAQDVDVLAPCALGDAIDESTVKTVRARVVAGAANNVFSSATVADRLQARGVIYAVDFVANAGGIVYDDQMVQRPRAERFDETRAKHYVDGIFDRTLTVFEIADAEHVPYWQAGLILAERNRMT
jgi:glutamate dehydrogenase/leucine dehydrogenase